MRFLYFGDLHRRLTSPENRVDDFQLSVRTKIKEILRIGELNKVEAYLQPGDFWDKPAQPIHFVMEEMRLWAGAEGTIKPFFEVMRDVKPIIGVIGNHEMSGGTMTNIEKDMAGFLGNLGFMRYATKENPIFFETEDGLKVAITGTHYHLDIDKPGHLDDYVVEEKLGDIHIHIVHGYLTDESKGDMFHHTLVKEIAHTKADLTLTGHDHIGFDLIEIDGKYFMNPGSPVRLSNDIKEIKRQIQVVLLDITKENGLQIKKIPLASAKEGKVVLDRTKNRMKKAKLERLEEFKQTVRQAGLRKHTDIQQIIREMADNKALPQELKDIVTLKVAEKMSELKPEETTVSPYKIEKIVIKNFEAHADTVIECGDTLNIFVGESGKGKSSILRTALWIMENNPLGKDVIRQGEDHCKASMHLSNGMIISRVIGIKSGSKNGYEITNPLTGETEFHNTKILPVVQQLLGYQALVIDKDTKYTFNFMEQGTGWFLIGKHFSAPARAKIIGGLFGTQYADSVVRDIDSTLKRITEANKRTFKRQEEIVEQIGHYQHLPMLEEAIREVEVLINENHHLEERKKQIQLLLKQEEEMKVLIQQQDSLLEQMKQVDEAKAIFMEVQQKKNRKESLFQSIRTLESAELGVQKQDDILCKIPDLPKLAGMVVKLKRGLVKREAVIKTFSTYQETEKRIIEVNETLEKHSDVSNIRDELVRSKKLLFKKEQIDLHSKAHDKSKKALTNIERSIKSTESVSDAREQLMHVKEELSKRKNLVLWLNQYEQVQKQVEHAQGLFDTHTLELKKYVNNYQEKLKESGVCPVCYGDIDKRTTDRIVEKFISGGTEDGTECSEHARVG